MCQDSDLIGVKGTDTTDEDATEAYKKELKIEIKNAKGEYKEILQKALV
jgi:hypothetical protein